MTPTLWPEIDDRPLPHGETIAFSGVAADVDLTARPGKPNAPTAAVLIQSVTAGNVVLTMLGGGNITIAMEALSSLYLRIACTAIVDAGTVSDGSITVFWSPSARKN